MRTSPILALEFLRVQEGEETLSHQEALGESLALPQRPDKSSWGLNSSFKSGSL